VPEKETKDVGLFKALADGGLFKALAFFAVLGYPLASAKWRKLAILGEI
jgi:hypothetical protein